MEMVESKNRSKIVLWISIILGFFIFLAGLVVVVAILIIKLPAFLESRQITVENSSVKITNEENAVIEVVKKSQSSVVSIAVSKIAFTPENGVEDVSSSIGTGFVVDSSGLIITNQHVVSALNEDYKVVASDGKEYEIEQIVRDDINDIALLKVDGKLDAIGLGDSDKLQVGQMVIAIGTPLGQYAGSVTTGIVSGLNRSVSATSGFFGETAKEYENVIQTDAAINPGNSGGPLINSSGEVIGVSFATTSGADNISFALPINVVKDRLSEYRKYGKFITPYLGVEYQMISESTAIYYDDVVAGALVVRIVPNSPASKAGIKRGDIIVEFNGEKVRGSLVSLIQKSEIGQEVPITIYRNAIEVELRATLEEVK